jgi:hypothetical protein
MLPSSSFAIIHLKDGSSNSGSSRPCLVVTSAMTDQVLEMAKSLRDISESRAARIFQQCSEEISQLYKMQDLSEAVNKVRESSPEQPNISERLLATGPLDDAKDTEAGLKGSIKLEWLQDTYIQISHGMQGGPIYKWTCFIAPPKAAALKVETQIQLLEALWKSEVENHGLIQHRKSETGSDVRPIGESSTSYWSSANVGLTRSVLESVPEGPESAAEHDFTTDHAPTGDPSCKGDSSRWPSMLSKLRKGKGKRA